MGDPAVEDVGLRHPRAHGLDDGGDLRDHPLGEDPFARAAEGWRPGRLRGRDGRGVESQSTVFTAANGAGTVTRRPAMNTGWAAVASIGLGDWRPPAWTRIGYSPTARIRATSRARE